MFEVLRRMDDVRALRRQRYEAQAPASAYSPSELLALVFLAAFVYLNVVRGYLALWALLAALVGAAWTLHAKVGPAKERERRDASAQAALGWAREKLQAVYEVPFGYEPPLRVSGLQGAGAVAAAVLVLGTWVRSALG